MNPVTRVARIDCRRRTRKVKIPVENVDHLDGDQQGFVTLVGILAAGAVHRLLHIVGGQHTEADRNLVRLAPRRPNPAVTASQT